VAGGVLGMELLARLVLTDFYRCDAALGWTFEPGKTGLKVDRKLEYAQPARINEAGFHDVEHVLAKPPDTVRIVVLGDSMLAAMQVPLERTLARQLEARLNEARAGGSRFEVVNCATDGYGTAQAWLMFDRRCRAYQPDLVVLGFFAFNDVLDNYAGARSLNHPIARRCGRPYFELREGLLARAEDSLPAVGAGDVARIDRVLRRSYLYQIVAPPLEHGGEGPKLRSHHVFWRDYGPDQWRAWDVTKELLQAFDRDVRASGARLAVLVVPSRFEIHPAFAREQFGSVDRMDLDRPRRLASELLIASDLTHFDLTPGIRAAAERQGGDTLYFRRDAHLTEAGNAVASELVAAWIGANCRALGLGSACEG